MVKDFLKRTIKSTISNTVGFYCPKCSLINDINKPTAKIRNIYDRKYYKFKSYIKCQQCNLTTPAYEKYSDIFDIWDDYFIKRETELFKYE